MGDYKWSTAKGRGLPAVKPQTEKQFQNAVVQYARLRDWRIYHTYDSRRSAAGFPDLTLVRGNRLVFAELKSEKGKLTEAQEAWISDLRMVLGVGAHVWRPSDWPAIEGRLK